MLLFSNVKRHPTHLQVRGTVRDPNNKEKVAHVKALADALPGKLTLYAADLLQPGSFDEAVRCNAFHLHHPVVLVSSFYGGTANSAVCESLPCAMSVVELVRHLYEHCFSCPRGADVVFHTASPFQPVVEDGQRDLVDPAVKVCRVAVA